jgi:DNA-binding response OmpR family regulator
MEKEIGRAIEMGFIDYVTKPIKTDVFIDRIIRVLNKDQQQ